MIKNYLITTIRHLRKHRSYSVINIVGLSLGITCSLTIFLIIQFWLSFDTFHEKSDRIYRVVNESRAFETEDYTPGVPIPFADAFRTDFPEVENSVFVHALEYEGSLFTIEDKLGNTKNFQEELHIAFTEPNYFQIFTFPFTKGDPATALSRPNQIVLSEKFAEKYFSDDNIVGRTIMLNHDTPLVVTGVMQDYPENSSLQFDILISWATIKEEEKGGWGSVSSGDRFYALLNPNQDPQSINDALAAFTSKYYGEELSEQNFRRHYLQPLEEIFFDPRFSDGTVSWDMVWILGGAAAFLIFIACVNFVNLATATSIKRSKEVGVRKVLGGSYQQLTSQFLAETFTITIISILISLGLSELLLLEVNPLLDTALHLHFSDPVLLLFLAGLTLVVSLLSGIYPSWILARIPATKAFQGVLQKTGQHKGNLRRSLIIFQFVIAQVFVIGTLILFQQMKYVREADLGFLPDAIVNVRLPSGKASMKKALQTELERIPKVQQVSLASAAPTSGTVSITDYQVQGTDEDRNAQIKAVDNHYIDLYRISLLAGSGFQETDSMSRLVVNEAFVKANGWQKPEEAIGQIVKIWGSDLPIAGVVKDFHTLSLKRKIEPTIMIDVQDAFRMAAIKIQPSNISQTLASIEDEWSNFYPEYTFDFQFADEEIAEFYENEQKLSSIISIAALIVVLIGCLGLYGLINFMAEQKTKEVGVRKVLGASVISIVQLFSQEFIKLIAIAFIIAAPIVYYLMEGWLQRFAFKIDMNIWVFLAGMLVTLLIALVTVSYRSVRAAMANPVKSLRSE